MSSVKRKCFTIEEKSAILHRLEAGESNATLAKEFGVSHSTISTIKKNKDKIEPLFNANVLKCKRVRTSTHEQRDRGIPVNGPLLQEKANFFARQLDMQNFTCSMSWINRFKVRHNIVSGKIAGESFSVQQNAWTQLKQGTIFNCYKHDGFVRSNVECIITSNADDFNEEDDVPLSVWARAIDGHQLPITNEDFEQYAFVDDAVATCEEPSDENIVENIIANDANSRDSDGDDGEPEEIHPTLSVSEALKAAETLSVFVQTNFDDDLMKTMMSRIHNAVRSSYYRTKVCQKQTQITDFLR
ncbi:Tigger transposable element-derived protein [Operophtera brumata]|uniref:Tigger transposable element-derived protein n=1 Tax=Operophtera brumata TaxID=104452 RepID=A0A0L7K2P7_OPEBR|nr:Tigger transposable element-derived protein [Operophtera brumata]